MTEDSKKHWLALHKSLANYEVTLGKATAQAYVSDPRMIGFIAARYKFAAKMLAAIPTVLEVGCGDAFGSAIVAQTVGFLTCTDIDRATIEDNKSCGLYHDNMSFAYHDFLQKPFHSKTRAAFLLDVIEHIFPSEESVFIEHIVASLEPNGILIIGTPNKTAAAYASPNSQIGHVNLKTHTELRALLDRHFSNVFMFGMNDEVLHTGYPPMAHYLLAIGVGQK